MNIILDDFDAHLKFAPLTLTRPIGNLRVGILTNDERWALLLPDAIISFSTASYLSDQYKTAVTKDNFWVNAAVIPNEELVKKILDLSTDTTLFIEGIKVAHRGETFGEGKSIEASITNFIVLKNRWDLYQKNAEILSLDFKLVTKNKTSKKLSSSCQLIGDEKQLFIADSAKVEGAILNTTSGPIYIGENAEIMEGSVIRGGLALCEHAALKLATKVYGATTLGPHCKVGGEVNNVIFQAYSNKGHDGFLGNSIIGAWCNIGADTNTSNLKNNYGKVKTYDYTSKKIVSTDVQFMGVAMGDHTKTGINTMLNTATVIGVSATVFGAGFPPKYIPSFSWGGFDLNSKFEFNKVLEAANNMMTRRGKQLTKEEIEVLSYLNKNNL